MGNNYAGSFPASALLLSVPTQVTALGLCEQPESREEYSVANPSSCLPKESSGGDKGEDSPAAGSVCLLQLSHG